MQFYAWIIDITVLFACPSVCTVLIWYKGPLHWLQRADKRPVYFYISAKNFYNPLFLFFHKFCQAADLSPPAKWDENKSRTRENI